MKGFVSQHETRLFTRWLTCRIRQPQWLNWFSEKENYEQNHVIDFL